MYRERDSNTPRSRSQSPKSSHSNSNSVSENIANTSSGASTDQLTEEQKKELKKKERLARIQQWKAQKAKEKEKEKEKEKDQKDEAKPKEPVSTGSSGSNGISNGISNGSNGPNEPNRPTSTANNIKPHFKPAPKLKRTNVKALFMTDEEDFGAALKRKPPKKLLTESSKETSESTDSNKHAVSAIDSLDAFMSQLDNEDAGVAQELPEAVMNDQDDQDQDQDGDNDVDASADSLLNPEEYMAMIKQKDKKDIPPVDHSKMNYIPFRKNFYIEPRELRDLTEDQLDELRLELDGIKVKGVKCPKPVLKWSQLGLPNAVMNIINGVLGYSKPSSIQAQGIPAIMSGRDIIGVAKTGSGKTMAFLLPMFRHIKDQPPLKNMDGPIALIMTPTRELALQIYRDSKPFLKALDLRAVCAYGGTPIKDQIAELKRGAEIVVCTPGRMIDLLTANQGRVTNLSRVTYLVLDEADRMFDMGFEPQVMKIVRNIRPDRQTVLFSATFPRQMEALARKVLVKPVEIVVGARSVVAPEITQIVHVADSFEAKFVKLLQLLGDFYHQQANEQHASALIFVERQDSADMLFRQLIDRGYPSLVIHGGKDQIDRDSAISDFKNGLSNLLIATSVAARGLDVKHLKLVINYDPPNHMEDYVHRVGRTGRAGATGTAVTLLLPDQERNAVDIARALKLSHVEIPTEVQAMVDNFEQKVKDGKEMFHGIKKGFGGNGLEKLDGARKEQRLLERRAYGEDDVKDKDKDKENDDSDDESTGTGPGTGDVGAESAQPSKGSTPGPAESIVVVKNVSTGTNDKKQNSDLGAFHAKLEVNDFPQRARWNVTSSASLSKVTEMHGVSVTLRGMYYPSGKIPGPEDEPKLYLLIEGPTEVSVLDAYRDLQQLLVGGIEAAASTKGRYTV